MPRPKNPVPSYSHHKPTDQAYVRVSDGNAGRHVIYLCKYDSPAPRAEYSRMRAELAVARSTPPTAGSPASGSDITVNELLVGFWHHAERHYRRADGTPTNELPQYRQTFRLVKDLYGHTPAREFGP